MEASEGLPKAMAAAAVIEPEMLERLESAWEVARCQQHIRDRYYRILELFNPILLQRPLSGCICEATHI